MLNKIIIIFLVLLPYPSHAKMSLEEITFMFGSAMGVISSKSCGSNISLANKAQKQVIAMITYELKKNQITRSNFNFLKDKLLSIKQNDTNLRHPSKTCKSARKLINHLFKK